MGLLSWKDYCLKHRRAACIVASVPPGHNAFTEKPQGIDRLNEATKEDLTTIKGIGPKTAQTILENGPYENFGLLQNLKSVSKKVCEAVENWANSES